MVLSIILILLIAFQICIFLLIQIYGLVGSEFINFYFLIYLQSEAEVQALTKKIRQMEEEMETTERSLLAASEKLAEASKAADESERYFHHIYCSSELQF